MPHSAVCDDTKKTFSTCVLFDAITHQSLKSVPGLVYVKKGKGFTAPNYLTTGGDPFPYHQGGGRCVNANCRTDPLPTDLPLKGVSAVLMEDNESWCDTVHSAHSLNTRIL